MKLMKFLKILKLKKIIPSAEVGNLMKKIKNLLVLDPVRL